MRATAVAFSFNAPRFISCMGPLIAGTLIVSLGGTTSQTPCGRDRLRSHAWPSIRNLLSSKWDTANTITRLKHRGEEIEIYVSAALITKAGTDRAQGGGLLPGCSVHDPSGCP